MFKFELVGRNGEPVESGSFSSSIPTWRPGETLVMRPGLAYRVVEVRAGNEAAHGVLVVERV